MPQFRLRHVSLVCTVCAVLVCSVMSLLGKGTIPRVHAAAGDGSPGDPNISYVGRWDTSSAGLATSYWGGAYLKTSFTGTTVSIKLAGSANIYANIDNTGDVYYAGANGTVNLTPTPLSSGVHTLRVAAKSEWDSLQFQGLVLDPGATTVAPTVSSTIIEFVGDSITSGLTDSKSTLSSYGWLSGEQLGVEHTHIAFSGICLVDQCNSSTDVGMSTQFFKEQTVLYPSSPDWDFQRYQVKEVVINLGTNDNGKVTDAQFQSTYTSFIQHIRQKYPTAAILVLETFLGEWVSPTQAAVQAVNDAGDSNVYYIDTTGWIIWNTSDYNDGAHPSDAGHAKIAQKLVPILQAHLPATPTPTPTSTSTPTPTPVPGGWTKCADEGGTCTFSGTQVVRYGANGQYAYKTATGSIGCNNTVFGDPIVGTYKACATAPVPPTGWTKCANENGTCSFSGTMTVAYGANGQYAYKTATNSIGCNNNVFGDPIFGTYKGCYYL